MGKHSATTTFDRRNENISQQQRDQILGHTPNSIEVWTSELFRLMGGQVFPTDTFVDISEVSGTREPDELMGCWIQSLLLIVENA